jgi:hypothetical protein
MDGDSTPTEADRFRDLDENGAFSNDLYYTDVDGDHMRRIGMIDKYVCGCWTSALNHDDRPRPIEKKPAPPKPPISTEPKTDNRTDTKTEPAQKSTPSGDPKSGPAGTN